MAGRFSIEGVLSLSDRITRPLASIEGRFSRFSRRAEARVGQLNKTFDRMNSGLMSAGKVVGGVGLAAAGGVAVLASQALSVEDELQKVGTVITPVMGSIDDALARTKKASLEWSKAHTASSEEFLKASYNMSSAGLNEVQAIAGTRSALTLATATMGDAVTAGNLLATVYNNMGDKSKDAGQEMGRLSDVLATTQARFQIADLSQLNEGLKYAIPSALNAKIGIEELSTVVGALNTAGLQGSQAGTAFASTMSKMTEASAKLGFQVAKTADGGTDFIGTLANIENKFGKFSDMTDRQQLAFQKAFGSEGLRTLSLLAGKSDELAASLEAVTNSTGNAAKAEARIESSRTKQLEIMKNRLRAAAIGLGDAFLPVLDKLSPVIERITSGLNSWVEKNGDLLSSGLTGFLDTVQENIEPISRALTAIGIGLGVFYTYGAAVKMASGVTTAFNLILSANPLTLWIIAIAAVSAALYYFWPQISEGAKQAWDAVSKVTMQAWEGVKSFLSATAEFIVGILSFTPVGAAMIYLVGMVNAHWGEIRDGAIAAWEGITSTVSSVIDWITSAVSPIGDIFNTVWKSISDGFSASLGWVIEKIGSIVDAARSIGRSVLGTSSEGDTEDSSQGARPGGLPPRKPAPEPHIVSSHERAAQITSREISEKIERSQSELVIRDQTGRAELTRKPKSSSIRLQQSGAY